MMDTIVMTGYHTLQLIHFYTAGTDEVSVWSVCGQYVTPAG